MGDARRFDRDHCHAPSDARTEAPLPRSRAGVATIDRSQRAVLYTALVRDLARVGTLAVHARGASARDDCAAHIADAARLLDDLGWDPDDPRASFPLTVPARTLTAIVRRIHACAADRLRAPHASFAQAERDLRVCAACRALLEQLGEVL